MTVRNSRNQETDFPQAIGNPARRALEGAGYTKLKHLVKVTEAELIKLHGVGPKALRILRETLEAKGMSFAAGGKSRVGKDAKASDVDEFMSQLDHPFKEEVQIVRDIIKSTDKGIIEEVKWKAPSFSYNGEYLVTFNLRETKRVHLVFHNRMIPKIRSHLLEGDYVDRRMTYFANMKDIKANKVELERVLKQLVKLNAK